MPLDYRQISWDDACRHACRELVRLAMREDLGGTDLTADITTASLVPPDAPGHAIVAARKSGVIAGLPCIEVVLGEYDPRLTWEPLVADGSTTTAGQALGRITGPANSLLTAERTLLNILGRLSGIATLTRCYVEAVAGTRARIYDTRKTTPGWRLLEKYAVRIGGGHNHRLNLAEGILIKDNHLALGADPTTGVGYSPAEAVRRAKERGRESISRRSDNPDANTVCREIDSRPLHAAARPSPQPSPQRGEGVHASPIEVEIDRLDQLDAVLAAGPDIVLLDNMTPDQMRTAVAHRDRLAPAVELEASGGVDLVTVAAIARAGVDRISVGALTHSAMWLDIGLDWQTGGTS